MKICDGRAILKLCHKHGIANSIQPSIFDDSIQSFINQPCMLTKFTDGLLHEWITHFEKNPQLPAVTTSALISLQQLEDFIAAIKLQQADCVRLYFMRFDNGEPPFAPAFINGVAAKGCEWVKADQRMSQTAIALVPARNFKHDKDFVFSADDIVVNGEVITLLPGTENEGTGLNPPGTSGGKGGG